MKKWMVWTLLVCMAVLPGFALADSSLRVQGSASVKVKPDTAILEVGFSGENEDSTVIQEQATDAINAITTAILGEGIPEDDISTAYLNTYPVYNYTDEGQTMRGYRVEHMLSVTVRDMDKAGSTLDAALKAGANAAGSIQYKSSEERKVYLQALALAVENATEKADALAIASGVWLGTLEEVNEITNGGSVMRYAEEADYAKSTGAGIGSTVMAGDLDISATVELVYKMR